MIQPWLQTLITFPLFSDLRAAKMVPWSHPSVLKQANCFVKALSSRKKRTGPETTIYKIFVVGEWYFFFKLQVLKGKLR